MEEPTSSSNPLEAAAALSAEALRELRKKTQNALKASREHAARLEADITRQLDELAATLTAQLDADAQSASEHEQEHAEVARLTKALQEAQSENESQRQAFQAERDSFKKKIADLEARSASEHEHEHAEVAQLNEALAAAQRETAAEREALDVEREKSKKKVADLETRNRTSQEEWRDQLLGFESRLRDQHQSWNEQRAEWTATRTDLERERDEVQQKFELALQDVQHLRERVAELEHDLARRPAADQADSTELVALRAERDALAQRIEELEKRPPAQLDPDVDQQLRDLQRRFELAVEDVRELKTKNAQLESQLASAAASTPARHDAGAMDWESQKRRMLAALEETPEEDEDPERQQERVTIQGTIEITDSVVAEKDRLIAELEARLESAQASPAATDEAHAGRINELIDADEIIASHRQRHQQLEREMEEKLRAAELELSVERAKMARQRVELDELKATLEQQRQLFEANGGPPQPGAPKRRWLSKLGINDKDKE